MPDPNFRLTLVLEVDGQPYSFVFDGECSLDLPGTPLKSRFKLLEAHVTRQETRKPPAARMQKPRPRPSRKPGPQKVMAQKAPS